MTHVLGSLFKKELRDTSRDRRTLLSGFAYASLGPVVMFVVLLSMAKDRSQEEKLFRVCEGSAPGLVSYLRNEGFVQTDAARVCLRVSGDYAAAFASARPAKLTIVSAGAGSDGPIDRLKQAIERYGRQITAQRLLMRGITTSVVQPIELSVERLGAPGRGAILISALVIPFFVTAAFLSSMASAIDTTAGERERRSMETLLILPAEYAQIVLAKWATTALVGIAGTVLTVAIGFTVLWFTPMPELGSKLFLNLTSAAHVLVLLLPLTLAVSAVQLLIGFSAKTYKEGTSYLTLLSFLPLVAGLTALRASDVSALPLPVFWEVAALRGPLLDAWPSPMLLLSGVIVDIALCAACLFVCTLRLRDPRVLNTA